MRQLIVEPAAQCHMQNGLNLRLLTFWLISMQLEGQNFLSKGVLHYEQEVREYVKAHDQYMLMAIGNAPWPIGVTAVGIHDRTGRERIGSNKIAHIMDDEGTRKSLNAIKRILTYCQKVFPTDPSKMVFN